MTNKEIKRILLCNNVMHLYHANTVGTSCTYIRNGGLLSRGAVKDRALFQTGQETDASDQEFDVFYDIFFDSVDIHERSRQINYYGPVTFVYSVDLLDVVAPDSIRITKSNPKYWTADMQEQEKYFMSGQELLCNFVRGNFGQHITLRHQTEPLPASFLEKIILDDPHQEDNRYFIAAYEHLQKLLQEFGWDVPLVIRQCGEDCRCAEIYNAYRPGYIRYRFGPA